MKPLYKKMLLSAAILGCMALLSPQTSHADTTKKIGFMHPLGSIQSAPLNEVGTIIDKTYGAIRSSAAFILEAAHRDTPVYASRDGEVIFIGDDHKKGVHIDVLHADMSRTTYGLLSDSDLAHFGSTVQKGDIIGYTDTNTLYYALVDKEGNTIRPSLTLGDQNRQNFTINKTDIASGFAFWIDPTNPPPIDEDLRGYLPPISNNNGDKEENNNSGTIKTRSGGSGGPQVGTVNNNSSNTSNNSGSTSGSGSGSASSGSDVTYVPFAGTSSSAATDAVSASATALCPESVATTVKIAMVEEKTAVQEGMRQQFYTDPADINELSCFDNFATTISTVVADMGISGAFDVFGVGGSIGGLIQSGIDSLAGGACDQSNKLLDMVRDAGIDPNVLFQGALNPGDLLINLQPELLNNLIPKP